MRVQSTTAGRPVNLKELKWNGNETKKKWEQQEKSDAWERPSIHFLGFKMKKKIKISSH